MALSVANGWQDVKSRVKNIGDVSVTQQLRQATIINRQVWSEKRSADPSSIISSSADTTLSSDYQAFANAADFKNMTDDGTGIFKVNDDSSLGELIPKIVEGESRAGWFITSTGFTIQGFNEVTIRQKYVPALDAFTVDTENFVVDEDYRELIDLGLLSRYYFLKGRAWDVDYQNWKSEYEKALMEFADELRRDSGVSTLEDHESAYG